MKNLYSKFGGNQFMGPEIWPHEYLISPILMLPVILLLPVVFLLFVDSSKLPIPEVQLVLVVAVSSSVEKEGRRPQNEHSKSILLDQI